MWDGLGKTLIVLGVLLVGLGGLLLLGARAGFGDLVSWFGRLPGDILVKKDNFTFYFPLATGILVSIIVSLLLFVISTIFRH